MSKQTTAVGYARVTRVGGRGGDSFLSPELQREQIALAARREGLEVADVLEELDASGGNRDRQLWNEAIRRVEDGEVGAVIVWKRLSPLSRRTVNEAEQAPASHASRRNRDPCAPPSARAAKAWLFRPSPGVPAPRLRSRAARACARRERGESARRSVLPL